MTRAKAKTEEFFPAALLNPKISETKSIAASR
jgi:hypothetical protein